MKPNIKPNLPSASLLKLLLVGSCLTLLFASCQKQSNTLERPELSDKSENSQYTQNSISPEGQVAGESTLLPTKTIKVNNQEILVEFATTDEQKSNGLSNRNSLADGAGMLFDFTSTDDLKKPGFWMKDMNFSIDIVWIKSSRIIGIEKDVPVPPEDQDLTVYYPPAEIDYVLELPAGWSGQHHLGVGSEVQM